MGHMTEEVAPDDMPEREIEFQGRKIWVKIPQPEVLLVWRRTANQLEQANPGSWTGESVMVALDRLRKIIDTVLVNKADSVWIDDQLLDGALDFQTLTPLILQAIEAFTPEANREERRAAAKPVKKAVRKKTPRKAT